MIGIFLDNVLNIDGLALAEIYFDESGPEAFEFFFQVIDSDLRRIGKALGAVP